MTYKSLLTVFPMDEKMSQLQPIINFAKALEAHIDIVIVGELYSPSDYFYGGFGNDSWKAYNQDVYKRTEELNANIEALVAKEQISANVTTERQFKQVTGTVLDRYALCSDLNVLSFQSIKSQDSTIRAYYRVLINAGRPVVILTEQVLNPHALSNVVIGWNGKAESAKAIYESIPLLREATHVFLVMIDPEPDEFGANPGHDIALFLARHDVTVTVDPIVSEGKSIADALLQRTIDVDADLLVIGAYGTTKLKEWLIGGTTQEILNKAKIPLFLSH